MAPTIRNGDVVGWMPADRWAADALYVLFDGFGPVVKRCQHNLSRSAPAIRVFSDNPVYPPYDVPLATFNACVLGRVFAICQVVDRGLMEQAGMGWQVPGVSGLLAGPG